MMMVNKQEEIYNITGRVAGLMMSLVPSMLLLLLVMLLSQPNWGQAASLIVSNSQDFRRGKIYEDVELERD